jgi:hypothetical protein
MELVGALMGYLQPVADYLVARFDVAFYVAGVGIWLLHFFRQTGRLAIFVIALAGLAALLFVGIIAKHEAISIFTLTSVIWLYGVCLYVVLCDLMLWKFARFLTSWRGPQWTKEIDYFYLSLASVGIIVTLNRFEFVTGHIPLVDVIAPLILTTAIVLRYIKTRAEIEGWNA